MMLILAAHRVKANCWIIGNQPLCVGFAQGIAEDGCLDFVYRAWCKYSKEFAVEIFQLLSCYVGKQDIPKSGLHMVAVQALIVSPGFGADELFLPCQP
nr:hypothetical protein [Selenomonas ruminantium]